MAHPYYKDMVSNHVAEIMHVVKDKDPTNGPFMVLVKVLQKIPRAPRLGLAPSKTLDMCMESLKKFLEPNNRHGRLDLVQGNFNMWLGALRGNRIAIERGLWLHNPMQGQGLGRLDYINPGE